MSSSWHEAIGAWVTFCRATGVPNTTIVVRRHHMQQVAAGVMKDPWKVTLDDLITWLAERTWAPNTRRSYRTTMRSFWGWALATGRTATSPAHLIPPIRVPRGKPRPTPEDVYRRALEIADARQAVMITLAAHCGLRRGEISAVRRDDLRDTLTGRALRVIGKGGHVRIVPIHDELADLIDTWPVLSEVEPWLFPSPRGGHLTPHHVGKLISRCLPDGWTTHTLRHRCATVAYAHRRDLRAVQELLGHQKPETTALYTQIPDDDIRAAMMAAAA